MILLTSKNIPLSNNSKLLMEHVSVGLAQTETLFVISDDQLTELNASVNSEVFSFVTIDETPILKKSLSINDFSLQEHAGKHIYRITLMFLSEVAISETAAITIDDIRFEVSCESIDNDEQLLIMLQNFKKFISDDAITAMYDSVPGSVNSDSILYNRKMREYLLNMFEFTSSVGSYKGLMSALKLFGYGELLSLREYWAFNENIKSTTIGSSVLTEIDKHLTGFSKTNMMSLVYQINQEEGSDEDGLPMYSNVLANAEMILTKLWALSRVLEKDFVGLNTHIVDIIGEFQSVLGLQSLISLNEANISSTNISDNQNVNVTFSISDTSYEILHHSVLIDNFSIQQSTEDSIEFIPGLSTALQNTDIFDVIMKIDDSSETEDFDMLTKFYSADFALISIHIDADFSRYQSYKWSISDESGSDVFISSVRKIDKLIDNTLLIGCKKIGSFKLIVSLLDNFGNATIWSPSELFTIYTKPLEFFIAKYDISGTIERDLQLWSTFQAENGISVVDPISESLDIMTWDVDTNIPAMTVNKYYESDFDQHETLSALNNFNSIPLNRLNSLPLLTWGDTYALVFIDIIGDRVSGSRFIEFWSTEVDRSIINYDFDDSVNEIEYLTNFVATMNQYSLSNTSSSFAQFTWSVHFYGDSEDSMLSTVKPVIRGISKQKSVKSRLFNVNIPIEIQDIDFPDQYFLNDEISWSRIDAKLQFGYVASIESDILSIIVNDVELHGLIETISDINALKQNIDDVLSMSDIHDCNVSIYNDTIIIYSKYDISISHVSIGGRHSDVTRNNEYRKILPIQLGSDVNIGEPVFAFPDNNHRVNYGSCNWLLRNELTNKIESSQNSWAFRWIIVNPGAYSLTFSYVSKYGAETSSKYGCILVM